MSDLTNIYVFGCFNAEGHHVFTLSRRHANLDYDVERAVDAIGYDPGPYRGEGYYQPEGEIVRRSRLHAVAIPAGWSFVSWWDRQGDQRGNSHTGILAQGEWTNAEMIAAGRQLAPWAFRVEVKGG